MSLLSGLFRGYGRCVDCERLVRLPMEYGAQCQRCFEASGGYVLHYEQAERVMGEQRERIDAEYRALWGE